MQCTFLKPTCSILFYSESKNSDDTDLYEIPVIKNAGSNLDQSADSGGYEETKSPTKDDYATTASIQEEQSPETIPPPLPPRREKSEPPSQKDQSTSENTFPVRPDPPERQSSINGNKPPDLPARPNLPTRSEIYNMAEKKEERSEGSVDLTGKRKNSVFTLHFFFLWLLPFFENCRVYYFLTTNLRWMENLLNIQPCQFQEQKFLVSAFIIPCLCKSMRPLNVDNLFS
jgi:hypothetical protein